MLVPVMQTEYENLNTYFKYHVRLFIQFQKFHFVKIDKIMMCLKWYMMDVQNCTILIQSQLEICAIFTPERKIGVWQLCLYVSKVITKSSTLVLMPYKFNWVDIENLKLLKILKDCENATCLWQNLAINQYAMKCDNSK